MAHEMMTRLDFFDGGLFFPGSACVSVAAISFQRTGQERPAGLCVTVQALGPWAVDDVLRAIDTIRRDGYEKGL